MCLSETEVCVNTEGAYDCVCAPGYKRVDVDCVDINECHNGPCDVRTNKCVNTLGSFDCKCQDGYKR